MRRPRIRQLEIDFLCLSVFGMRALPDDMAERIERRREGARAIAAAFDRNADLGPAEPEVVEAVAV